MSKYPQRNNQLAAIHVAKKQLGLDDETYRAVLWTVARVHSAADLDSYGRAAVLDHFKARGWQATGKRIGRRPKTLDRKGSLQKIEAQLTELKAPWGYADAIAAKVAKVDRCEWLKTHEQFSAVIAALAKEQEKRKVLSAVDGMLERMGWTRATVLEMRPGLPANWHRNSRALRVVMGWLGDELRHQRRRHARD